MASHRRRARGTEPGLNKGVAVAIGVVVGLISIPVSLALLDGGPSVSVSVAPPHLPGWDQIGQIGEIGRGQHDVQGVDTSAMVATSGSSATVWSGQAVAPPTPTIPPISPIDRGRALVLHTLSAPIDPELSDRLNRSVSGLIAAGFRPVSNISDGSLNEDDVERLVKLRVLQDIHGATSDRASDKTQSWFRDELADEYELVVVIAADPAAAAQGEARQRVLLVDENSQVTVEKFQPSDLVARATIAVSD